MKTSAVENARVLVVTSELHGGSAFYVTQLIGILASAEADVTVSFFPNRRSFEPAVRETARKIVPLQARFVTLGGFLANFRILRRTIRLQRPQVIYTNTVFPLIVIALLTLLGQMPTGTQIVHTLHSAFWDRFRSPAARFLAKRIEWLAGLAVDRVIAPSQYMRRLTVGVYAPDKVLLIHNALAPSQERRLLEIRTSRAPEGRKSPLTILFVGRLDRQKGIDVLLKAFYGLKAQFAVQLCLAGVSSEDLASRPDISGGLLDGVVPLGWLSDTSSAYLDADLFVMPSRWEAFGLTLLEARLAGIPCVASNVDAIPELIPPASGILVPPDDAAALARALDSALRGLSNFDPGDPANLPRWETHRAAQLQLLEALTAAQRNG